jgi:hypothetical protein
MRCDVALIGLADEVGIKLIIRRAATVARWVVPDSSAVERLSGLAGRASMRTESADVGRMKEASVGRLRNA